MATYEYDGDEVSREFPALGVASLWIGLVLVLITAVAQMTQGTQDTAANGLQIILLALILASGVYLAFRASQGNLLLAAVPLLINVWTLIIVQCVPFASLWEQARFQSNLTAYQHVVALVEAGELVADMDGYATLPAAYHRLSANGRVLIDRSSGSTRVFFFLHQPTGASLAGYLYRSDGAPPQSEFGGAWTVVLPKRPSWYYCARSL
ncbi:MAG: hypothetical protein IPM39_12120 [Chloroflexi bacterium]|nr:hypothetical protein [Chloroflexota bacterium]